MKAIEEHGKQQLIESNALIKEYDYDSKKERQLILKQKEIFNQLVSKKLFNISLQRSYY